MKITLIKSDAIGIFASSLCMIHCLVTPFIFIAQSCNASCCSSSPNWWSAIDFGFLLFSFFAVISSVKTSINPIVKRLLWILMFTLFLLILNEKTQLYFLPEFVKYTVASSLILLHLYNSNYCQCKNEGCCSENISSRF